ncbi:MAG: hypothetical protein OXB88_08495 [Bacteriovoracales bacterium]|nr:hypothetical protein [Bacteriovoracales bacterium]
MKNIVKNLPICFLALFSVPAFADVAPETSYVVSTLVMLLCAALIMWMAAGFCMLEAGMVQSKSTAVICLKNLLIYSISCICFYLIGYNLMFLDVDMGGGWIGSFTFLSEMTPSEQSLVFGTVDETQKASTIIDVVRQDHSSMAGTFFQMTFVATAASVISGAVAERIRLWAFFLFVALMAAFIYPIQGAWSWGGGWLADMGFVDFAGSTVVHSVGGWAAFTGAYFLGPRKDKYQEGGVVKNYFPSSVPFVSLGVFILWFGWLGFNGGSLFVTGGVGEMSKMSLVFINTNLAACGGAVCALLLGRLLYGRINILLALNGALAGLVSITAGPDFGSPLYSIMIGAVGSALATVSVPILDKLKIDDVVGAIPVHLVAGIWGTLAVGIWGPASFTTQLIGVLTVGWFVGLGSALIWWILKKTIGIRVSEDTEDLGQDLLELGIETEPDSFPMGGLG